MVAHRMFATLAAVALVACSTDPVSGMEPPLLVAVHVPSAPTIDGSADEAVWQASIPLLVTAPKAASETGLSIPVSIRAIHTDTHLFLLVSWQDPTPDASHETWIWSHREEEYEPGDERQNRLAVAFEHTGPFNADVLSGVEGVWVEGRWTLELGRALDTGHPDDSVLEISRTYAIAVAPLDPTREGECAAGVITLAFGQAQARQDFDDNDPGVLPAGFTSSLTGRGEAEQWVIRDDPGAPSGRRVAAQTSADKTNYRFPLLVHQAAEARDLDVSVRFKPVSGSVDQAAGLVWRYQDENNYYVVRANALENNVVPYKVENGKRSDLPVKGAGSSYGVRAEVHNGQWQSLRVTARGPHFDVYLNDQKLFEVEDETFTAAGRVGLWTKADSVTYFDDFTAVVYPNE